MALNENYVPGIYPGLVKTVKKFNKNWLIEELKFFNQTIPYGVS